MSEKPLWEWPEVCQALGIPETQGPGFSKICFDSRRCEIGDLFVALEGDPGQRFHATKRTNRDGHDYINEAIQAGAVGILSHDGQKRSYPELKVDNTLTALWTWAAEARKRLAMPTIAITGSSGKTTAKSFYTTALDGFSIEGSFNNHIGVPLSIISTPRECDSAIFELGTNHPGEISKLSRLVSPDIAVLLNVHKAHIGQFRNENHLKQEKLGIFDGLKKDGRIVVEESLITDTPKEFERISFGVTRDADVRLLEIKNGIGIYSFRGKTYEARVPGGRYPQAITLASTFAVLAILGLSFEKALDLATNLIPKGRGDLRIVGNIAIVDDSYNANPDTMVLAIKALTDHNNRSIAILGDMLELGSHSGQYHRELAEHCKEVDKIICVGSEMANLYNQLGPTQKAGQFESAGEELIRRVLAIVSPGDRILVKGSNNIFWSVDFVDRLCNRIN